MDGWVPITATCQRIIEPAPVSVTAEQAQRRNIEASSTMNGGIRHADHRITGRHQIQPLLHVLKRIHLWFIHDRQPLCLPARDNRTDIPVLKIDE